MYSAIDAEQKKKLMLTRHGDVDGADPERVEQPENDRGHVHEHVVLIPQRQLGQPKAQDGHDQEEGVAKGQAPQQVGEGVPERPLEQDDDAQAVADQPEGGHGRQHDALDVEAEVVNVPPVGTEELLVRRRLAGRGVPVLVNRAVHGQVNQHTGGSFFLRC